MINLSVVCDSLFIMFWSTQGCLRTWQLTKNILALLYESLFPVIISKTNLCPLSNFTFFRFLVKDFFYGIRQGSNGLGIKDLKRLDKHKNLNWGNTYCFFCCRIAIRSPTCWFQLFERFSLPRELSWTRILWFCSWDASYDSLLGTNKAFPQPIPLAVSLLHLKTSF